MRANATVIALALSAGLIAACGDKAPERDSSRGASQPGTAPRTAAPPPAVQSNVPTTPANVEPPKTVEEKKEGANPVQGQVDPKESEQHKDFKQRGDAAGPKAPETQPRS